MLPNQGKIEGDTLSSHFEEVVFKHVLHVYRATQRRINFHTAGKVAKTFSNDRCSQKSHLMTARGRDKSMRNHNSPTSSERAA
ncbi:hypothetical protein JOB18_000240 [Solea senegalensis]|uniref:Uncharacterized protein n=1 Tax=Solea senegalensis TaxID=28829 RepID=A0AAV6SIC2_SOLSE|nr:hypothetical protein JOB18_000240 [Solea senegalensis]